MAAKKKYSFKLHPDKGKVKRVKVEISGTVEGVDTTWITTFLQDIPHLAEDYDVFVLNLEAKEV
jgi:hypothetical protein